LDHTKICVTFKFVLALYSEKFQSQCRKKMSKEEHTAMFKLHLTKYATGTVAKIC